MFLLYYNVCDYHAFIKGNSLTYLLTYFAFDAGETQNQK